MTGWEGYLTRDGAISWMIIVPELPEAVDPELRNGLARVRIAAVDGRCPSPCGAERLRVPEAATLAFAGAGNIVWRPHIPHDVLCPARSTAVEEYIAGLGLPPLDVAQLEAEAERWTW